MKSPRIQNRSTERVRPRCRPPLGPRMRGIRCWVAPGWPRAAFRGRSFVALVSRQSEDCTVDGDGHVQRYGRGSRAAGVLAFLALLWTTASMAAGQQPDISAFFSRSVDQVTTESRNSLRPVVRAASWQQLPVLGDPREPPPPNQGELPAPSQTYKIPLSGGADAGEVQITNHDGLISLIVRDAPLKDVLAILAHAERLNVVCADNVNALITVTLDRVRLEDALSAMCGVAGCTWVLDHRIIHVSSIAVASGLLPHIQGRQVEVFVLDFASAEDLNAAVTGMLTPVGSSYVIVSSPQDNRKTQEVLVVEDVQASLSRIRIYIAQMDQPPRQVLIEAHILSIDLDSDNRHGINFDHVFQLSGNTVNLIQAGMGNPMASPAFFATVGGGHLTALVELLRSTNDAKTLASPRVLVVNGQEARIQVGEQLGFRVTTTTETSSLESVDFLDVGVVLTVTPRISRDGHIIMHVKPEVSSGNVNPDTGLPEEETTEVETDILLPDGQGMVIGGLIQEKDIEVQSKIPFLGDIFLIGKLFQRKQVIKKRSEIIITLLPRIVPYDPHYQEYEAIAVERTRTALLQGPLHRVPRPWEPKLHDAIENPIRLLRLPPLSPECAPMIAPQSTVIEPGLPIDVPEPPIILEEVPRESS